MLELIYTSAPRGLLQGRSGYTTVAMSAGMPPNLITPVENLSGYTFTCRDGQFSAAFNPVCCSYLRKQFGNMTLRVVSRIAPCGLDYSGRNNKIAHHLLLESAAELAAIPGGAVNLFRGGDNFRHEYCDAPRELPVRRLRAAAAPPELPAAVWRRLTGDAGWAGAVAARFRDAPEKPFYLVYPVGTAEATLLNLTAETAILLTHEECDFFTFSTFFQREQPGEACFLRMIPEFSPLLGNLRKFHARDLLDLTRAPVRPVPPEFADRREPVIARRGVPAIELAAAETVTVAETLPASAVPEEGNAAPPPVVELPALPAGGRRDAAAAETAHSAASAGNHNRSFALFLLLPAAVLILLIWGMVQGAATAKRPRVRIDAAPSPAAAAVVSETRSAPETAPPAPAPPAPVAPECAGPTAPQHAATAVGRFSEAEKRGAAELVRSDPEASFRLFRSWRNLLRDSGRLLVLPETLPEFRAMDVELAGLGGAAVPPDAFVIPDSPLELHIPSGLCEGGVLRPDRSSGAARLVIRCDGDRRELHFRSDGEFDPEHIHARPGDLARIYWRDADGKVHVWKPVFEESYWKFIPPGRLVYDRAEHRLRYRPSPEETEFRDCVAIRVGGVSPEKLARLTLPVERWNGAVLALQQQSGQLADDQRLLAEFTLSDAPPPTPDEVSAFFQKMTAEILPERERQALLDIYDRETPLFLRRFHSLTLAEHPAGLQKFSEAGEPYFAKLRKAMKRTGLKNERLGREHALYQLRLRQDSLSRELDSLRRLAEQLAAIRERTRRTRKSRENLELCRRDFVAALRMISPELENDFDRLTAFRQEQSEKIRPLSGPVIQELMQCIRKHLVRKQADSTKERTHEQN